MAFFWRKDKTKKKVEDKVFLLIGKTGNGKSATGNSVLGWDAFDDKSDAQAVTKNVKVEYSDKGKLPVKVVDSPGVCDTDLNETEDLQILGENMGQALTLCSEGFHAMLLVLRFGNRFTQEEKVTVQRLKRVLGERVTKEYTICIFSHGDDFHKQKRAGKIENDQSFEDWCKAQKGDIGELLKECDYRCLLFENLADKKVMSAQKEALFQMVSRLKTSGAKYTCDMLEKAQEERDKLVTVEKVMAMKEDIMRSSSLVREAIHTLDYSKDNPATIEKKLRDVEEKTETLLEEISAIEPGTEKNELRETAMLIMNSILDNRKVLADKVDKKEWERRMKKMADKNGRLETALIRAKHEGVWGETYGDKVLHGMNIVGNTVASIAKAPASLITGVASYLGKRD